LGRQTDTSFATAFYYFDFNNDGKRDAISLVRALVAQLLAKIPTTASYLEALSSQIGERPLDIEYLLDILKTFIQQLDQTYLVIDALDECQECEELMKFIEELHDCKFDGLHILVASRQIPEIEEVIADCATSALCLQTAVNQDISILIQGRLSSDRKFQKWPFGVRREIEEALTGGACGMSER
jgi:hypothetical protein